MPTYAEKLKDPRWQKKRLKILERDHWKCRDCDSGLSELQVHHCAYSGRDPWEAPDDVLLTLCEDCHEDRQAKENEAHLALGRLMAKLPPGDLDQFVPPLVRFSEKEAEELEGVEFHTRIDYDYYSDIRWYLEALDNEEMQRIYELVTKQTVDWKIRK